MCNRYMWLFTLIFWTFVYWVDGWRGIGIIIAFSAAILLVIWMIERRKNDRRN